MFSHFILDFHMMHDSEKIVDETNLRCIRGTLIILAALSESLLNISMAEGYPGLCYRSIEIINTVPHIQ